MVFTEQGVAMLSGVLRSKRAIMVNIQIMRTFSRIRELVMSNKELREKLKELEQKYDGQFGVIFDILKKLINTPESKKSQTIGFRTE